VQAIGPAKGVRLLWTALSFEEQWLGHANGIDVTEFHQRLFDLAGGKTEWWSYLVAWLGQMLIEPAHMPPIMVLLFSHAKGIGKNMFFEGLMKQILGSEKTQCGAGY
jgi:hypothetical protein